MVKQEGQAMYVAQFRIIGEMVMWWAKRLLLVLATFIIAWALFGCTDSSQAGPTKDSGGIQFDGGNTGDGNVTNDIYQEQDTGLSDAKAKARVRLDRRYVEAEASYQRSVAFSMQVTTRFEQLKRSEKVISREQSRRAAELEALRHETFGGKAPSGRPPFRPGGR